MEVNIQICIIQSHTHVWNELIEKSNPEEIITHAMSETSAVG